MTHTSTKNPAFVPGLFNLVDRFLTEDFNGAMKKTHPAVNIVETENSFDLALMAPGLSKADFKIGLEKNLLTISYDKKEETTDATPTMIRQEFSIQSFKRSFTLTDKLNTENIKAIYENGILNISIAKAAVKEVEVKTVEIL